MIPPLVRIAGLLAPIVMAGCTAFQSSPAGTAPEAVAERDAAAAAKPAATPAPERETAPVEPEAKPLAEARAEPAPKKEIAAGVPAKPTPARPLDLNGLEKRLRDTEAIGVMTKFTLKNQVNDLLGRFEAHHGGTNKTSLAELRQPFDLLILKVLSLVQDRDAPLAREILASREAIWGILSDPAKFEKLINQNRS